MRPRACCTSNLILSCLTWLNEWAGGQAPLIHRPCSTRSGRPKVPGSLVRPLTSLGHRSIAAAKLERSPGPQMRARIREPECAA